MPEETKTFTLEEMPTEALISVAEQIDEILDEREGGEIFVTISNVHSRMLPKLPC